MKFLPERGARYGLPVVIIALVVGLLGIPVTDQVEQYFSTNEFCTSCHLMEATVYQELQESPHWTNPEGVQPGCADCHISKGLTAAMWDHIVGTNDLISFVFRGIRTPEDFETIRAEVADKVRFKMLADGNKTCAKCHTLDAIQPERKRGQVQHADARENKTACIACHYNLVHKEVELSAEFEKATDNL